MKTFIWILILIATLQLFAQDNQGFFLDDWQKKTAPRPAFLVVEKPVDSPTTTLTINYADTVTRVCKYVYGNNANTWSGKMYTNKMLVDNIKNMNPHVLRYPGGNLSNNFFWDRQKNDRPDDIPTNIDPWYGKTSDNWVMNVDDYYNFLEATNSVGIISINYSYARYGTSADPVAQAAHLAAEWVRYDNGRTTFWEIGNENFGNWQTGYEIDTNLNQDGQPKKISGDVYGRHALVFMDSMRAAAAEVGHTIKLGVQTYEEETSWDAVQTDWNEKMFPVIGNAADFFIVHNYYTPYNENSTAKTILNTYKKSSTFKRNVLRDAGDAGVDPKPITMTEWNIFAVNSMQQVSFINGLHASLVLGQFIADEYGLAARWDLANGWGNGNDHGTFARGDDPGMPEYAPRPVFHHMTFFQRYLGDVMVETKISGSRDIIAYASSFSDGPAGVVIVNKGAEAQVVQVDLNNFSPADNYYYFTLVGDNDNGEFSRKVIINGEGPRHAAGGPADYNDVPAFASHISGGIVLTSPPYSAIYMLINGEKSKTGVDNHITQRPVEFRLEQNYPNPFNPQTTISYSLPSSSDVTLIIYDVMGQVVRTLLSDTKPAGRHDIVWNALDDVGHVVPSGVYVYKLTVGADTKTKKLTLLR